VLQLKGCDIAKATTKAKKATPTPTPDKRHLEPQELVLSSGL